MKSDIDESIGQGEQVPTQAEVSGQHDGRIGEIYRAKKDELEIWLVETELKDGCTYLSDTLDYYRKQQLIFLTEAISFKQIEIMIKVLADMQLYLVHKSHTKIEDDNSFIQAYKMADKAIIQDYIIPLMNHMNDISNLGTSLTTEFVRNYFDRQIAKWEKLLSGLRKNDLQSESDQALRKAELQFDILRIFYASLNDIINGLTNRIVSKRD